jgi:hypothetical protein
LAACGSGFSPHCASGSAIAPKVRSLWSFEDRVKPIYKDAERIFVHGGNHDMRDATMLNVISSKLAMAKLSEKDAWRRYAEAKGDNWGEAFAKWVEARDASMAAWAEEIASRRR